MTLALQTERLILRQPTRNDWNAYRDFMMSPRACHFPSNGDLGQSWKSFAAELGHWEMFDIGMWAVTRRGNDSIIGLVGPWHPPHWPEQEIGWMMLSSTVEGRGFAAEAARASLSHAYDVLGWHTAVSYIWPDNDRSIRLAESLGAVIDGSAERPAKDAIVYRHPRPGAPT